MSENDAAHAETQDAYWSGSLRIVQIVLGLWAVLSLGGGILLRSWLDDNLPNIGGAPCGFWIAQQGAVLGFLCLLVLYMFLMNRLDRRHGYAEGDDA